MGAHLGHKVTDKKAEKWARTLAPSLLAGEEILALAKCNNLRPQTEGIAITNFRIGGLGTMGWSVEFPYVRPFVIEADAIKETLLVTVADPEALPPGSKTRRADMLFKMVQKEDHELLVTIVDRARATFEPSVYQAVETQATSGESAATARAEAVSRGVWPAGTRVVGSPVSKKAGLAILRQCHDSEEMPWLVLGTGTGGVLAAWDERLAIIKTGAMTGMMAGSLGGERTATFHFVDITGIEYNSGILSGVLEVLTASYSGGRTKDFWGRGENDPFKQSNCLPLAKASFNLVASDINELRSRIAMSKRPSNLLSDPRPQASSGASTDIASQLKELAVLHDAGVLTDEEFAAAKQAVISGP